jgi:hypothetical protein
VLELRPRHLVDHRIRQLGIWELLGDLAHALEGGDEAVDHIFRELHLTNFSRHLLDRDGIDRLLVGERRIVFALGDGRLAIVFGGSNLPRQDKD